MEYQRIAIRKTILAVSRKYGKAWCTPSQGFLLKKLRKRYHIKRSIRTLNRRLREMEDAGEFTRTMRTRRAPNGKKVRTSSLYRLGGRVFNWAYQERRFYSYVFSSFHLPKMAAYQDKTARDLSSCGSLDVLVGSVVHKGGPPAAIRSP